MNERDPRFVAAAADAAAQPPPGAQARVWKTVKAPRAAVPWPTFAIAATASIALGVGLVGLWRIRPATLEAPAGVSQWVINAPRTISTCQKATTPCLSIKAPRGAQFMLDTSTEIVRLAVQVGAVQITAADGTVREVLASQTAEYRADALREARDFEAEGDLVAADARLAEAARGDSLSAEAALYAQGVLRLRRTQDLQGALKIFEESKARFPHGALAPEAALSSLETLSRLGRTAEAASAAAAFLLEFPDNERAAEVRRFENAQGL